MPLECINIKFVKNSLIAIYYVKLRNITNIFESLV